MSTAEPLDDGRPDYHARLVGMARSRAHPELKNTTYPSRGAAQAMRDLVNQLADAVEALVIPEPLPVTEACNTCGGRRTVRIVNDLYRPDRDAPCPTCVGWPLPGVSGVVMKSVIPA